MVFRDKYELLTFRGGDGEIGLPGREISSGRPVFLHLLTGGYAPENQQLLDALKNLSTDQRGHLIESGDHDGIPYVITDLLPDNLSLRRWAATAVAVPSPPSAALRTEAHSSSADPGEFTRLFQPAAKPAATKATAPAPPPPPPAALRTEANSSSADPGEFTRLFQPAAKPAATKATAPVPPPAALPTEANSSSADPGEFTRLFQPAAKPAETVAPTITTSQPTPEPTKAPAAPPSSPAPPAEPAAPPGEFTAMFQSPQRGAAATATSSKSVESTGLFQGRVPSPPPQRSGPGEFTQAMQPPLAPGSNYSKPAPAAAVPQSEFTRMMEGSALPKAPPSRPDPLPQAQPRTSPQSQGEFTRMFEAEPEPTGNLSGPPLSQAPLPHGGLATGAFSRHLPPAPSVSAGQSDFTKMISVPSSAPAPAPSKAPKPAAPIPPTIKKTRSYLPLILILGGLLVLALILILVFALMR
jgi:hypothetical protein